VIHEASRRRGASLVELMVALTLLGILSGAVLRLFVSQSRFVDRASKQRSARAISRASMNFLLGELRAIEASGGVVSASPSEIELRAPYAMGLTCGTLGGRTIISVLPVDSAEYAGAVFGGYASRSESGEYSYYDAAAGAAASPSRASVVCEAAGISTLRGGRLVALVPELSPFDDEGRAVLLYQQVKYAFAASVMVPNRIGLWRSVLTGPTDEMAAPFDTTSRFRFFRRGVDSSEAMPPSDLRQLRGIELLFTGASESARAGGLAPETATQRTAVYFLNRPEQ
jgi:prepilin-type N-terminal cleavage/methylation domain-containing protein